MVLSKNFLCGYHRIVLKQSRQLVSVSSSVLSQHNGKNKFNTCIHKQHNYVRQHTIGQKLINSHYTINRYVSQEQAYRKHKHWLLDTRHWEGKLTLSQQLCDNIVFQNEHMIALNKPHDLPMQSATEPISLKAVLPELKERLNVEHLEIGLSLDRAYSGVTVLSKTPEMKARLAKYLLTVRTQKEPCKTFWGITTSVPLEREGADTLAVELIKVGKFYLGVAVQEPSRKGIKKGNIIQPTVHYKVLSTNQTLGCSLIQLQPTSTKWDFPQVFIAQRLLTTLLGDHTYSGRVRSILGRTVLVDPGQTHPVPQLLAQDLLEQLQISKDYIEWIPLHLHCVNVAIPYADRVKKQLVNISAPLPEYFQRTAETLGLRIPDVENYNFSL